MVFGVLTDEDKMGVSYSEISEYILTGETNKNAKLIIDNMHNKSAHKRNKIPVYDMKNRISRI